MPNYTVLKMGNVSEAFKKKTRLTTCISFAIGMIALTATAVAVGIFIGYTFCYIEHHTLNRNITNLTSVFHIHHQKLCNESEEVKGNRTINGALASSLLVSRIMNLGQALMDNRLVYPPWHGSNSHLMVQYA